jgi:transitional endoplasmic reticulum ATPase
VPLPDAQARSSILRIKTARMPLDAVDLDELVARTEGFAGADLESLCREAAMIALREDPAAAMVGQRHFEAALKVVRASCTKDVMKWYEEFSHSIDPSVPKWQDPGVYR